MGDGDAKAGQYTPATISDFTRQMKHARSGVASAAESRIQLKIPQGQNYSQLQGKQSPAKPGQQNYANYH